MWNSDCLRHGLVISALIFSFHVRWVTRIGRLTAPMFDVTKWTRQSYQNNTPGAGAAYWRVTLNGRRPIVVAFMANYGQISRHPQNRRYTTINVSKSSCMRMGPRFKVHCSNIVSMYGHEINWPVYLTANNVYSCSYVWLVAWNNGITSVFSPADFTVLRSTCIRWVTTYVGKPSAIGQPTRPTQPFIPSGSINE